MSWIERFQHAFRIARRPDRGAHGSSLPQWSQWRDQESRSDAITPTAESPPNAHCITCGYDLRGLPPRAKCPECGTLVSESVRLTPVLIQRRKTQLTVLAVGCALFVVVTEGPHVFAVWNCLPVLAAYIYARRVLRTPNGLWGNVNPRRMGALLGFTIAAVGATLVVHLAWVLDLGQMATSSSTAAILFVFLPVYTIALGMVGSLIGLLLVALISAMPKGQG